MNIFKSLITRVIKSLIGYTNIKSLNGTYKRYLLTGGIAGLSTYIYLENKNKPNFLKIPQPANNNFFVNVTEECSNSVVAIEVKNSQRIYADTGEPMLTSTGSGFIVMDNGWVLTNAHVIMNKPNSIINIITRNGDCFDAEVRDIDLKLDLALLKTNCLNIPAMKMGSSQNVSPGEWVVALGNPLSMKHTTTAGVVSSVERNASELGMKSNSMKYLQTDAAITFGHSGGPLVNLDGEVIGVNNLRITAGIAFAIPIDYVKGFIKRSNLYSKENEQVQNSMKYPKFGISTIPINSENIKNLAEDFGTFIPENTTGILVWNVLQNSPASKAGLIPGDIITQVNRKTIKNVTDFYKLLRLYENKTVIFTIHRGELITDTRLEVKDK